MKIILDDTGTIEKGNKMSEGRDPVFPQLEFFFTNNNACPGASLVAQ